VPATRDAAPSSLRRPHPSALRAADLPARGIVYLTQQTQTGHKKPRQADHFSHMREVPVQALIDGATALRAWAAGEWPYVGRSEADMVREIYAVVSVSLLHTADQEPIAAE
jgi:hypothetical protein